MGLNKVHAPQRVRAAVPDPAPRHVYALGAISADRDGSRGARALRTPTLNRFGGRTALG